MHPDVSSGSAAAAGAQSAPPARERPRKGVLNRPPVLAPDRSAELSNRLLRELALQLPVMACSPRLEPVSPSKTLGLKMTPEFLRALPSQV